MTAERAPHARQMGHIPPAPPGSAGSAPASAPYAGDAGDAGDARAGGSAGSAGAETPRLLDRARGLSSKGHPDAPAAWQQLDEYLVTTGTALPGADHAELLDHLAMRLARTQPAAGAAQFDEAAELFTAAQDHGSAAACRARAALATAFAGAPADALARLLPLSEEVLALHRAGRADTRQATAVLLSRARVRELLLDEEPEPTVRAAELDAELARLAAFADPGRAEPVVLARIAEIAGARARLAGRSGDTARAAGLLAESAALSYQAGRPWQAVKTEVTLAQALLEAGEPGRAEAALAATLDDPQRSAARRPQEGVRLSLALADVLAAQERAGDETARLLDAAHFADAAGDGAGLGAYARLRLGGAWLELGRPDLAADVLEAALPDLLASHTEAEGVQARWWLGQALSGRGEHRRAAGQFRLAARTARGWENQRDHAMLTHLAADAWTLAGEGHEARETYERAEQLWRALGERCALVRAVRSRAWLVVAAAAAQPTHEGPAPVVLERAAATEAAELMASALREAMSALKEREDPADGLLLQYELGLTYRQMAALLLETTDGPPVPSSAGREEGREDGRSGQDEINRAAYQEALLHAEHAVTVLRTCGEQGADDRTEAELTAGELEMGLGRQEAAVARARGVLAAYPVSTDGTGGPDADGPRDGTAGVLRERALALLAAAEAER